MNSNRKMALFDARTKQMLEGAVSNDLILKCFYARPKEDVYACKKETQFKSGSNLKGKTEVLWLCAERDHAHAVQVYISMLS